MERKNRTIFNMVRNMLQNKKRSKEFCGETASVCDLSTQQMSNNKLRKYNTVKNFLFKLNISYLMIFGFITYTHVLDQGKIKQDDKSSKYILISYKTRFKVYKLFDLNEYKVYMSRDIEYQKDEVQNQSTNKNKVQDEDKDKNKVINKESNLHHLLYQSYLWKKSLTPKKTRSKQKLYKVTNQTNLILFAFMLMKNLFLLKM